LNWVVSPRGSGSERLDRQAAEPP